MSSLAQPDTVAPERPLTSSADESAKRRDLTLMKRRATGLLLMVTAVFLAMRVFTDSDGFAGYVEAAAEAAMVGGLADWFAVTALFRHPLAIPIPHTAIIPKRKDQIGASLGTFVQDNFLESHTISDRVRDAHLSARLADWMVEPGNAARIGDQLGAALRGTGEVLRDDDVAAAVEETLIDQARKVDVAPLLGRALTLSIEGGHHQRALDATLAGMSRLIEANHEVLRSRMYEESPWWVPPTIDDRVFDKITTTLNTFILDIRADPNHEVRGHVERNLVDFAQRLHDSPELQARGEELKNEVLDHPEVRAWLRSIWGSVKAGLIDAAETPDSALRRHVEAAIIEAGRRLESDPTLQAKVDGWLASTAAYLAEQSKGEVADLIATQVARWDPDQTGERIELQVGRDLQFIRINGTVVGGLAGIVIHAIGQLVG